MRLRFTALTSRLNLTWRFAITAFVFGALIAVILNALVGRVVTSHALEETALDARFFTARQLIAQLTPEDLQAPMEGDRLLRFQGFIESRVLSERVVRVKIWSATGQIIYSDDLASIGQVFDPDGELLEALAGHTEAEVSDLGHSENVTEHARFKRLVEVYTPITFPGSDRAAGVFEIYQAYDPIAQQIASMRLAVTAAFEAGLLALSLAQLWVVRGGTRVIRRQTEDLQAHSQELERANATLQQQEERFRSLVVNASDVLLVVDGQGLIDYAGPSVAPQWGYAVEDLQGSALFTVVHMDDRQHLQLMLENCSPGSHRAVQFRLRHRTGLWVDIEAVATNLSAQEAVGGIVLNCRDVTERARFEQQLVDLALHDPLTGLPNRALFTSRVDHALTALHTTGASMAVMFMDLDRFKVVNDTLGHATGDQLLVSLAQRLQAAVRPHDTVARLGGDEFAIVLPEVHDADEAIAVAERIIEAVRRPIVLDGHERLLMASIGIAIGDAVHADAGAVLRNADIAMYQAKARGGGSWALFDPQEDSFSEERLELESALRGVAERGELRLQYQPSVDLQSGEVIALEALVRWQHPQHGLMPPDDFVALATETGDIVAIGRWVLQEACKAAQQWQGPRPLTMRVNLSAGEFEQPDLVDAVARVLQETGLPPERLEIEITETALLRDSPAVLERLNALKRLGVRLAVDDFGTGYSSLGYLTTLPVDRLKIDRSFVEQLDGAGRTGPIVRAIMMVGAAMDISVTAEGIETAAQLAYLQELQCDDGQGFLFARPLDAAEVTALLDAGGTSAGFEPKAA